MLRDFQADLHIHTCLSPCGSNDMLPADILAAAASKRLDVIAVCDHNATDNVRAVRRAARGKGIAVLGGLEITSREEVHILGLFDDDEALLDLGQLIAAALPGANDQDLYGEQLVLDDDGNLADVDARLLIGATELSVEQVVAAINERGGLAIASHVDRQAFGIIGQLGFVPPGLALAALELSPAAAATAAQVALQYGFPVVTSSDAHYLDDIGACRTTFTMAAPSLAEIRQALRGLNGRKMGIG